jgi:hypothetical protein
LIVPSFQGPCQILDLDDLQSEAHFQWQNFAERIIREEERRGNVVPYQLDLRRYFNFMPPDIRERDILSCATVDGDGESTITPAVENSLSAWKTHCPRYYNYTKITLPITLPSHQDDITLLGYDESIFCEDPLLSLRDYPHSSFDIGCHEPPKDGEQGKESI